MDEDRDVIARLKEHGADLSRPREVLHYLHLPTREAADWAVSKLPLLGYRPRALTPDPASQWENPWTVIAITEMVVTAQSMEEARDTLERLVGEVDGEYDGWEAAVEP